MKGSVMHLFTARNIASTVTLALVGLAGCATPDVSVKNPLVAGGTVAPATIKKPHSWAESHNGLPPGSMTDEATLDNLDDKQVCVTVLLHELAAIDLNAARITFKSNNGQNVAPTVAAEPPVFQTYQGLVPHQTQTGTREECSYRNGRSVCETRPIYSTTMIPGPVNVYATKGRLCAANDKLVNKETQKVSVVLDLPTSAPGGGFMGLGGGSKDIAFHWGFAK